MSHELIIFIVMIGIFMLCCFAAKLPVGVAMMLAAIGGCLVGGKGIPIRHLVEGTFSYVDTILVISTAMVFMKVIEESGALDALSTVIIKKFHKHPAILLILIMIVIMFPGMITGSSTAAVLSAGSIMAPVLLLMGIDAVSTAAIIAMGGLMGMVAPPVNLPAMIIGGGIDVPFVGFGLPLLLLTVPVAIFSALFLGLKQAKNMDYAKVEPQLNTELSEKYGIRLYIPLLVLIVLMALTKIFKVIPDIGMPLMFIISAVVGMFTGRKFNIVKTVSEAVHTSLPVMGILMGVGMFIQVMTLTGVRGFIVMFCLGLPESVRLIAAGITIPLFGAVSSFGAASVLGVPFALAFLNMNTVYTIASLSFVASLGDMMPPTALAGIFAAQVSGVEDYVKVLKRCLVPMVFVVVYGLVFIYFSKTIAAFF
ncbi:TRAP transporter large permease subunit [Clostridium sp.]|uniref:TRAP transporter large permease subunit n=1 Tax=Clostridium sp. TaxID=1506 RepID=UPI00257FB565|nr:TRAP transporter large permease subunit [Clostridium sp.]MBD9276109.1 TRAP transporter large permease subunit [Clostridium sp.]